MKNKILIFPTDTVYGIGAKINDLEGIKKIYEIKGRDFNKPLAVLAASIEDLANLIVIDSRFLKLANAFWPGPLTIIVKTSESFFKTSGYETLGVRIPKHQLALKILKKQGPMKVTSINQSGEEPLNDYLEIKNKYQSKGVKIFNNKETNLGVSSTVVDVTGFIKILRIGSISKKAIEQVLTEG